MKMPFSVKDNLFLTADGSHSLISPTYGVPYHSKYGAIQETQHVFINAGLRPMLAKVPKELSVLEIGFGTGLNCLMTLLATAEQVLDITYHGYEAFPISLDTARQLNYPAQLHISQKIFLQLHEVGWNQSHRLRPYFELTKWQRSFDTITAKNDFDLIYFDAFAPSAQAEWWDVPFLQKMYEALRTGGVLTTYCAKGAFKRHLKSVGFIVEALPGPPGKREMTRATKS